MGSSVDHIRQSHGSLMMLYSFRWVSNEIQTFIQDGNRETGGDAARGSGIRFDRNKPDRYRGIFT
jgi:hypothetical protein